MGTTPIVSVVMAAGRGSRMGRPDQNKVCFDIDGVPAICHSLQTYERCGVSRHVIVVGHLGDQVRSVIDQHFSNVEYVEQQKQLGTGNAARCGAQPLQNSGYRGWVLVVAGDKVLHDCIVTALIETMYEQDADLCFVTGDRADNPASGRVITDENGQPVAIVEVSEILLSQALADMEQMVEEAEDGLESEAVLARLRTYFPKEAKLQKICGPLYEPAVSGDHIAVADVRAALEELTPKAEIELPAAKSDETKGTVPASERVRAHEIDDGSADVNLSVYLFSAEALYEGLRHLTPSNAQGEEYLTDVVKYLAAARTDMGRPRYSIHAVRVGASDECMGFNTLEELQTIRDCWGD
jgi:bifunctional N-acetylglucosamine-1-phosphate-uridyltransferase/glucosamine-1-phosphate-acetyltransferase GlmU-like protein